MRESLVTIAEPDLTIVVTDNTPDISVTSNTLPIINIIDNSTQAVTIVEATPQINIVGGGPVTIVGETRPKVIINLGVGGAYDVSTVLAMVLGLIDLEHLDASLASTITGLRDQWARIGYGLIMGYPEGVDLIETSQTQTNELIQSTAVALHVTIDGEVDLKISTVTQTAETIDLRVSALEIDYDGQLLALDSRITINADSIISTVSRLTQVDGPGGDIEQLTSQITQQADNLALEVVARILTDAGLAETSAALVLQSDSLLLAVIDIDAIEGRVDTAETLLSSTSIISQVNQSGLNSAELSLTTVSTMLANLFSVNITEAVGGYEYTTGFKLIIHPLWLLSNPGGYAIDDTVTYDGDIFRCISAHDPATVLNNPSEVPLVHWVEVVGAESSEFGIKADRFFIQVTSGPKILFSVTEDSVTIDAMLQSAGYVLGSAGYKLDPDNNTAEFHDMVMTFGGTGQSAAQLALNVADGADVTADQITLYNQNFEQGLNNWGAISAWASIVQAGTWGGKVLQFTGEHFPLNDTYIPIDTGRVYISKIKIRQTVDATSGGSDCYAGMVCYDKDWASLGTFWNLIDGHDLLVTEEWYEQTMLLTGQGTGNSEFPVGTVYIRLIWGANDDAGNGTVQCDGYEFYEDPLGSWRNTTDITKIDGGSIYASSAIQIGNLDGVSNYVVMNAGELEYYHYFDAVLGHKATKALKRFEIGSCNNGETVILPGYWINPPAIYITPLNTMCYSANHSGFDQSLQCSPPPPVLVTTGKYSITPEMLLLKTAGHGGTAVNYLAAGSADYNWQYNATQPLFNSNTFTLRVGTRAINVSTLIKGYVEMYSAGYYDKSGFWHPSAGATYYTYTRIRLAYYRDSAWHYTPFQISYTGKLTTHTPHTFIVDEDIYHNDITQIFIQIGPNQTINLSGGHQDSTGGTVTGVWWSGSLVSFTSNLADELETLATGTVRYLAIGE